ncbi:transcriptional regulator [Geothrix limicola]|uniref:Transcriptional regulator n=1 Tax=Geothrix limicola TaxID=2927978 RepID=A0ABQ5QG69_9BACT|nr:AraC family transcriptional regulator [Geothrix limicola]GLH73839.1 transcriptional regulator [Geothrix limicola]
MSEPVRNLWQIPADPEDVAWGLYITGVGAGITDLSSPKEGWRLLYLVRGAANLVHGGRKQRLEAGHLVILNAQKGVTLVPDPQRPPRAHRVDCAGSMLEHWARTGFFGSFPCILRPGFDEILLGLVGSLVELARLQPLGAKRLMSGVVSHMMARLETVRHSGAGAGSQRRLLLEARNLLADPEHDRLGLESIAEELGVSYSWFRQAFRRQSGLPPQRFRQNQRMTRACQLLSDTQLPVANIAQELGFGSLSYFSRVFRKETGLSPTLWRKTRP